MQKSECAGGLRRRERRGRGSLAAVGGNLLRVANGLVAEQILARYWSSARRFQHSSS